MVMINKSNEINGKSKYLIIYFIGVAENIHGQALERF